MRFPLGGKRRHVKVLGVGEVGRGRGGDDRLRLEVFAVLWQLWGPVLHQGERPGFSQVR